MLPYRKCKIARDIALLAIIIVTQILCLSGCGYHFTPGGEYIDKSIQTVFVDNFSNRTSEANVEITIRSAFIDQFIRGRRLKLVDTREAADAVLRGSVDNLTTAPLSYGKDNLAAEERLLLTMEIVLEERATQKIIWADKSFSSRQDYPFADLTARERNRRDALTKLANDSAENAYRLMMSGF
jgi:outer membrane lipopolysaccharide assembly protein LptE/RlpB